MHDAPSAEKINCIALGFWPAVVLQLETDNGEDPSPCKLYGQEKSNAEHYTVCVHACGDFKIYI